MMLSFDDFAGRIAEDLEPVLGRLRARWAAEIARRRLCNLLDGDLFSDRDRIATQIRLEFDLGRIPDDLAHDYCLPTIEIWRILARLGP